MTPEKDSNASKWRAYLVPAIAAVILLAGAYGIYTIVSGDDTSRKRVMETMVMQVVPPPPPPPEEKPPPEPQKVEEQKIEPPVDKPEETPRDEPPPGPLALDAQAGPGGDAFGLGGKVGGTDFLGGGGGGTRFGHYAILMTDRITQALHADERLNTNQYRATIRVWVSEAGKIERVQVVRNSGDSDTSSRIEKVLGAMSNLPEAPPKDMPQPVLIRIGARPGMG
jgi:hypothetical protein